MFLKCKECEYNKNCQLQEIAPDIEGCAGHCRYSKALMEKISQEKEQARVNAIAAEEKRIEALKTIAVGDKVVVHGTVINMGLPRYIEGGSMEVVGFTRTGKVKCKWDDEMTFNIHPCILKKCND